MKIFVRSFGLTVVLLLTIPTMSFSNQYFAATTGNDANPGTIDLPFLTLTKAIGLAALVPGDTIYIRGGTYAISSTISISKIGKKDTMYNLFAYPGERPVLDFSSMAFGSSNRGINLKGSYWYIKGINIYRAGDNGLNISGSNNVIECCAFYENQDTGCQLSSTASNNRIINCDSYFNYDAPNAGGNADGFSPKQLTGVNNYFYGCRSWQNSDDGWDCYEARSSVTLENCWVFMNGYLKDGTLCPGNGNGFKLGGNYTENDATLINCLAFNNKSKGFDQNHNKGSMKLLNCTGYGNSGNNYSISEVLDPGKILTLTNCIEFGNKRSIGSFAIQSTNSWLSPFSGATATDFVSIDTAGVRGPRKADGSLPDIAFMHLVQTSQFVNRGTDVGLPYIGTSPDLGCFETSVLTGIGEQTGTTIPQEFRLDQNFPNPFNPSTHLSYQIAKSGLVTLKVFDMLGREIAVLVHEVKSPGKFTADWNAAGLPSGLYFSRLESNNELQIIKMILMK